ncbi:MAG: hypothetical protein ABL953_11065 [Ilumatobacteraceae bacterium]
MGKVINAVATAVVGGAAEVVSVVDPNAGKAVASQAQNIGQAAELLTAKTGAALATAANATGDWIEQGVTKDGAITNFVQDYVPAGGFITAIAHAAAGNEEYAQYAAVKGVSTTVVTVAAVAGSLGGPAGAILAGGLAGAAVSAWEGGMKTVLDPSVQGKLDDLSVENVLISGAIGAAGAAVGVGVGKVAGAAGKAWSSKFPKATATEIGTVVQFTRGRAGAVVGTKLNPVIPLWQIMTPGQKISAIGGVAGKKVLTGAGVGGLQEAVKATGLTAAILGGLGMGGPGSAAGAGSQPTPTPQPTTPSPTPPGAGAVSPGAGVISPSTATDAPKSGPPSPKPVEVETEQEKEIKKKLLVLLSGIGVTTLLVGGGLLLSNLGGGNNNTTRPAQDTAAITTVVATTTATTIPATTVVATTVAAVVASTTTSSSTTTTAPPFKPKAPTNVVASNNPLPNGCNITVSWTAPSGTKPITYTVVGSLGGSHSTTSTSITFFRDFNGIQSFTVYGTNSVGVGPTSAPSNTVYPEC